jgi:hypothetical protein
MISQMILSYLEERDHVSLYHAIPYQMLSPTLTPSSALTIAFMLLRHRYRREGKYYHNYVRFDTSLLQPYDCLHS